MKKGRNQIQKILLTAIGVLSLILAAVLVVKGYGFYQEKQQEKEWEARHQEVQEEIDSVRVQIEELAGNAEALQAFLDKEVNSVLVLDEWQADGQDSPDKEGTDTQAQNPESRKEEKPEDADTQAQNPESRKEEKPGDADAQAQNPESQEQVREVMSEAIVIKENEIPQGETSEENGVPEEPIQKGQVSGGEESPRDGEVSRTEQGGQDRMQEPQSGEDAGVNLQGLEEAAEGAIIIDAPPAPKPPAVPDDTVSGNNRQGGDTVSDSGTEEDTVSGNGMGEEDTVSGNGTGEEDTVSGNGMGEEDTVSGNGAEEDTISGNAVVDGQVIPFDSSESEPTLEQRRNIRSSFLETMQTNGEDRAFISSSSFDFSNSKIACLGDSITEGSNLDKMENYQQYSYPSLLKNILQAKEVYNLGLGGSSYGRYWENAFVDRYQEIPQDTDIILVMGGTNDGFAASENELGTLAEKKPRTFYGDVDELMRGLKKDYPEAKIIFVTPLPNVLHDYLRNQRDYLLPQSVFADAVKELAAQYGIDVIDLYNSNLLDTHDAQIISTYMPDGVHGNPAGYQVLAEHLARSIIEIAEREGWNTDVSAEENNGSGETVSGNRIETVSGNSGESGNSMETVSGNRMEGDGTVSGDGTGADSVPEKTLTPEEAKQLEEERIRAEQERLAREREEAARAAENNKKVAADAVVITPSQETRPEETAGTAGGQGENAQDGTEGTEEAGPEKDYEYGGEAIVIR